MSDTGRGRTRRLAEAVGLVSDKPKPTMRQALTAFVWTVPVVVVAALVATAVERGGGPTWLRLVILVSPIWFLSALMARAVRTADARSQQDK